MAACAGLPAAATAARHTLFNRATHSEPSPAASPTARMRSLLDTTTLPTPTKSGPARTYRFLAAAAMAAATSVRQREM